MTGPVSLAWLLTSVLLSRPPGTVLLRWVSRMRPFLCPQAWQLHGT